VDSSDPDDITDTEKLPSVDPFENFKAGVSKLTNSDVKILLDSMINQSKNFDELKQHLQGWYDDYMDRVAGWYKRDLQKLLFWISLLVAVAFNIDTIRLAKTFIKDEDLRNELVAGAMEAVQKTAAPAPPEENLKKQLEFVDSVYSEIGKYDLPIGWLDHAEINLKIKACQLKCESSGDECNQKCGEIKAEPGWWYFIGMNLRQLGFLTLVGWLISTVALSMGAPFWFETLTKLVNIRGSGKKPAAATTTK